MKSLLYKIYGEITFKFGLEEFDVGELRKVFEKININLILHRLCIRGFVERVSHGRYRVIHPLIVLLEAAGWKWRDEISQKKYLPIIEFVVARLFENFWSNIVSIVIFGSLASGRMRETSDIDLLVVMEDLPENYSNRLKIFRRAIIGVENIRLKLWRERKLYPLIDPIILTREEASISHPFYLDMTEEAIIIFDKDNFMRNKLEKLKEKLKTIGAKRIMLPDGSWYWDLKPEIKKGEVIEI